MKTSRYVAAYKHNMGAGKKRRCWWRIKRMVLL